MAIWFSLVSGSSSKIQPVVAGVQTSADALHPVEIYYASPEYSKLDDMLASLNVETFKEDKVDAFPLPIMGIGSRIVIQRALPIEVTDAKKATTYRTWANDVKGLLDENNIGLLDKDTVEPALETPLSKDLKVKVTRVAETEVTEKVDIDFKTRRTTTADLEKGIVQIKTKGEKGQKENVYKIKRVDGEEVSRTLISSKVIKEPVDQEQVEGVGPKYAKSGPYVDTINAAAKKYLINGTALMCMMMKESNGHNTSVNPAGPYYGLFQYSEGFWNSASSKAGYGGASWEDATAQIYTTAWALTHGYTSRWPTWPGCANK